MLKYLVGGRNMNDLQKEILLSIQANMEDGMNFKDACSNAKESTSYDTLANELLNDKKVKKTHEKKRGRSADYSDKVVDGFAYGVGFNVAQRTAPVVQKAVIKGAKRYAEDHDLEMGYLAEFIEDHKYD